MEAKAFRGLLSPGEKSYLSKLCSLKAIGFSLRIFDSNSARDVFSTVLGCLKNYCKLLKMDHLNFHIYLKSSKHIKGC